MSLSLIQTTLRHFSQNVAPNSSLILSSIKQLEELIKRDPTVLVDFYANWCIPCKALTPLLEKLHEEKKSFTFIKVDVDKHLPLIKTYKVNALPTLLLFKNGVKEATFTGGNSFEAIKAKI